MIAGRARCALLLLCAAAASADEGLERLPIWPEGAAAETGGPRELVVTERAKPGKPRDRYATHVVAPDLTVFRAAAPSGCSLLIFPGGGYQRVVMDKEGYESARWFAAHGVAAFVLRYRLPGEYARPRPELPLHDAMRALRFVRAWADEHGGDADCAGVLGFSAGGHLAGLLATATGDDDYAPRDAVDRRSARPDFAVLMYPVVSMQAPLAHGGSREQLLGPSPAAQAISHWSVEERVTARTPPVFLLHAADDSAVAPGNTFALYRALRGAGVPAELHVFAEGGHGFGMRGAAHLPVAVWPELALRWIDDIASIDDAT
jgi:acetyl esterase/lipase